MLRSVLAVVAGYALWSILWLAGNQILLSTGLIIEGQPAGSMVLIGLLIYSLLCSLISGGAIAKIAKVNPIRDALIAGLLLFTTGALVQIQYWDLAPLWYHLGFLALLIPATRYGARYVSSG